MRKIVVVVGAQYSRWPRTRVGSPERKAGCVIQLFCQVEQLNVSLGRYTFNLRSGKEKEKQERRKKERCGKSVSRIFPFFETSKSFGRR